MDLLGGQVLFVDVGITWVVFYKFQGKAWTSHTVSNCMAAVQYCSVASFFLFYPFYWRCLRDTEPWGASLALLGEDGNADVMDDRPWSLARAWLAPRK